MKNIVISIISAFIISSSLYSQRLNIRILSEQNIKSFIFSPAVGKYQVFSDTVLITTLKKNEVISLIQINDSIEIKTIDEKLGIFKSIALKGVANVNYAKLKCVIPQVAQRLYDDDIIVIVENNGFYLINNVDLENYVAGVVECEGGQKADIEYYKTQAIICRTYALENYNRHINEGYNLCDDVHCQAFKGKSLSNFDIPDATYATSGLVIVDSTLNLITAGFHSNCGGQTANSEDVWLKPKSYLKSINDTFCIHQRSATWEKTINFDKWKQYLSYNGITVTDTNSSNFRLKQISRKLFYTVFNDSISLRKIRTDWNLRSTYFNVNKVGENIILNGRGYGHGVGLCQEGAMKMSKSGYSYKDIIQFYYKNTSIVNMRALNLIKAP